MQTHIITGGVVVNTIMATVAEAQAAFPDAICIDATEGGIGWAWDGTVLTAPPAPPAAIPSEVSMAQARKALVLAGVDLAGISAIFAAMPTPQGALAAIDWEFASVVHRDNPLVQAVAQARGMTASQVDDLFTLAATL